MRQIIDIDHRGRTPTFYGIAFRFVVTFVNGDSKEYELFYDAEDRDFTLNVSNGGRPKDLRRLGELKNAGKQPFTVKGKLADHLRTLLSPEELATCTALSLTHTR